MRRLEDWIDYMEAESSEQEMSQLSLLLKHSVADQEVLENLQRLRKWVKWSDPCEAVDYIIEDKKFEKSFQERVMATIGKRPQITVAK